MNSCHGSTGQRLPLLSFTVPVMPLVVTCEKERKLAERKKAE
jgi:hypothetical protein